MKELTIIILMLTHFSVCHSQDKFEKGFIITNSRDTLYGTVQDRKGGMFPKLYESIRFKQGGKRRVKKYSANQICGYAKNGQIFESINRNVLDDGFLGSRFSANSSKGSVFLKVILKGTASYYQLEWVEQESGTIETIDYLKKENSNIFIRSTQGIFGLKKKKLFEYFSDCSPLQRKIQDKELMTSLEIVKFYNNWISSEHD